MSNSRLEEFRSYHSKIESFKNAMHDDLLSNVKGVKNTILQEHRIKKGLDEIVCLAEKLVPMYEDRDHRLRIELNRLNERDCISVFHSKLDELKKYHQKHGDWIPVEREIPTLDVTVDFTGEEFNGRYLDMHEAYEKYINLTDIFNNNNNNNNSLIDYQTFLHHVFQFWRVPNQTKFNKYSKYHDFYQHYIYSKLLSFLKKSRPILSVKTILEKVRKVFEAEWQHEMVEGWQRSWTSLTIAKYQMHFNIPTAHPDCHNKPSDHPQQQQPTYCFVCDKHFKNANVRHHHCRSGKQHLKRKELAWLEYKTAVLIELLREVWEDTIECIMEKQTSSYGEWVKHVQEIEGEGEVEEVGDEEEGGEEEEKERNRRSRTDPMISNPLKIPLDFDGKPIPYWLYKFRGLNRYFECEICSFTYRGPRDFERHFQEWRHTHAMRRLNLANTKDFFMITKIKDALQLNQKINKQKNKFKWDPENQEEFEDNEGNVFEKATYDQLKRQGVV